MLAGDPKQLGPILTSPLAIQHGLGEWGEGWECCRHPRGLSGLVGSLRMSLGTGTSLLERLMLHNPLYKKASGGYDPQFITKLLWNYRWGQGWCRRGLSPAGIGERGSQGAPGCGRRECPSCPGCSVSERVLDPHGTHARHCLSPARSHEAILRIPNELFYDNELKVCESNGFDIRNLYCTWEELPKKVRGAGGTGPGGPLRHRQRRAKCSPSPGLPHHLPWGLRGRPEGGQEPLILQHGRN